ncbi:hypothetical protein OSTOST_21647 [Ostertagia ostertagi]
MFCRCDVVAQHIVMRRYYWAKFDGSPSAIMDVKSIAERGPTDSEQTLDLLLSAIHEELSSCFDAYFAVEDESFWTQVAPLIRLEHDYDAELPGMVCRVYMREESPWVLSVVVVPATSESIEVLEAIPLLFCLCDEPLLAVDLGKRNSPPPERILDRRYSRSPSAKLQEEEKEIGDARMPDDTISSTGSLRRADRPVDQFRLRHALAEKENGKHRNGDEKQSRTLAFGRDYPLFIYFMCSVEYPDHSMDTFPVTFLPTCIKEVLRGGVERSESDLDVKSVVVRLDLYVMTWPSEKMTKNRLQDESDTDTDEDTHSQRQIRFLEKMPKKVGMLEFQQNNQKTLLIFLSSNGVCGVVI